MSSKGRFQKYCMDILFPPTCGVCGERLATQSLRKVCLNCREQIRFLYEPVCNVCGMELISEHGTGHFCGDCLSCPPPFDVARSMVMYEAGIRHLVHELKYGGGTFVAGALKDLIGGFDLSLFVDCDWIVPVPLHLTRLRQRGVNQAAVLARLFFAESGHRICPDGLIRLRNTVAQTDLRGSERRKNLKRAFQVRSGYNFLNSNVCLVDDVFTTGTTVSECSKILKQHGANQVKVLTLARAGGSRSKLKC